MNASRRFMLAALLVSVTSCAHSAATLAGAAQPGAPLSGDWGGPHAGLTVGAAGTSLEFDCGQGSIAAPVTVDAAGRFDLAGVYIAHHGGPTAPGDPGEAARYAGAVSGTQLTLTVTLPATGAYQGPFVLRLGAPPRLVPCS